SASPARWSTGCSRPSTTRTPQRECNRAATPRRPLSGLALPGSRLGGGFLRRLLLLLALDRQQHFALALDLLLALHCTRGLVAHLLRTRRWAALRHSLAQRVHQVDHVRRGRLFFALRRFEALLLLSKHLDQCILVL